MIIAQQYIALITLGAIVVRESAQELGTCPDYNGRLGLQSPLSKCTPGGPLYPHEDLEIWVHRRGLTC
jgi:hypothetical protein